jgi:hypothetical protein
MHIVRFLFLHKSTWVKASAKMYQISARNMRIFLKKLLNMRIFYKKS